MSILDRAIRHGLRGLQAAEQNRIDAQYVRDNPNRCPHCWGHGHRLVEVRLDDDVVEADCDRCDTTGKPLTADEALVHRYLRHVGGQPLPTIAADTELGLMRTYSALGWLVGRGLVVSGCVGGGRTWWTV